MIIISAVSINSFGSQSVIQNRIQLYRLLLQVPLFCSQLSQHCLHMTQTRVCPFEACILSLVMISQAYFLEICKGKYLIFDATRHFPSQNMTKQAHRATTEICPLKSEDNFCQCDSTYRLQRRDFI